jgi:hypothetical protein
VTEVSYDSGPPDPEGVPLATHARYLEQAIYELWREGVDTIVWFQVRDQLPVPSYAATSQSGVYFRDGRPKPALRAFRFPLVAERTGRSSVRVWGRAPVAGTVQIEQRTRSGWEPVRSIHADVHSTFITQIRGRGPLALRGRIGDETSLTWRLG